MSLSKFFDGMHGVIFPFAGAAAPAGFLMCDGSAVSRTTYAALFAAIGTAFGVGDGSTTFNVPDLRGRTIAGKDDMGGVAASRLNVTLTGTRASTSSGVITGLASTSGLSVGMKAVGTGIGASAVINSIDSASQVTLSVNSTSTGSGSIRFGVVDGATIGDAGGAHNHAITYNQLAPHAHGSGGTGFLVSAAGSYNIPAGSNGQLSGATTSVGAGEAHPNVQPTMIMNWIIKT